MTNLGLRSRRAPTVRRRHIPSIVAFLALLSITLLVLYPLVFVLLTALKTSNEVRISPLSLPANWLWDNFATAWTVGNFQTYLVNSILIAAPVVIGVLAVAIPAAFAFGQLRFRGSRALYIVIVAGMALPLEALIIPLYFVMKALGLLNTSVAVILPMIGLILPFGILLLTGFISEIPSDLIDAARVDGASNRLVLTRLVLPLIRPAVYTLVIFSFLWTWNQLLLPTVMLTKPESMTLPVGLSYFVGAYDSEKQLLAAGALITALPVIALYAVLQRHFVRGITVGAVR